MNYKLIARPEGEVAAYTAEELFRYLSLMDPTLTEGEGGLALSLSLLEGDPTCDRIEIEVKNGVGRIAGVSPRAVLIAVYRFLYELGCRWTCPGIDGEHIPARTLTPDTVNASVAETPSYRYRGVCMEGAISEENVLDMIAFLPRVGLNTYFIQFFRPTAFFFNWRTNEANPESVKGPQTPEELDEIHLRIVREMQKRGIDHQAIGHGWTCEPYGVPGEGWSRADFATLPKDFRDAVATLDGEKKLFADVPLMTNLCYGREDVRRRIVTAVADYCEGHPHVAAVHLWLSDGHNNFCECERCRDLHPSDQYITLLNEVDAELTARGLSTKIVFLTYFELMFAPERERFQNPDRFILMMAPVSRSYSSSYADGLEEAKTMPPLPFARNAMVRPSATMDPTATRLPYTMAENITCLREWRKVFSGDGFLFDYYLIWEHVKDPGYMDISRLIFRDMQALRDMGLDGTVNCQFSRCALPIGLPMYGMARALWNREADFDAVADEYFTVEFGEKGAAVRAYLEELSVLFHLPYMRAEMPERSPELRERYDRIPGVVAAFRTANPELRTDSECMAWRALAVHADIVTMLSMLVGRCVCGIPFEDIVESIRTYVRKTELSVQPRFDGRSYVRQIVNRFLHK